MMRKSLLSLLASIAVLLCFTLTANAQVDVTPSAASYTTLKAAFTAINAGTHTGAVVISISGSTTETDSCVINASGVGGASYSSITMSPTGGAARTIQGNINGNFIVFNGADNFTINGLNSGGNSLTISNSNAGLLATTLRFFDDASSNTVTNCAIKGSSISNLLGTIQFQRGTTTGNDNNTISTCDIGPEGAALPFCAIYSAGASSTVVNNDNAITGCNIFDYFAAGSISYGIQLTGTGNAAWSMTNNKFYQTGSRTFTSGNIHPTISIGTGTGYVITGNTFGYASNSASGVYTMLGAVASRYTGINGTFSTGGTNRISNNTFRNFNLSTTSGASTTTGIWCAINVTAGVASIDSNNIGDDVSNNSIVTTSTTTSGITVGICSQTTGGNVSIQNNKIGSITTRGTTASVGSGLTGINITTGGTGFNLTLVNNLIGSLTQANSINCTDTLATATGSRILIGMTVAAGWTGNVRIANNTVRNLTVGNSAVRHTGTTSTFTGISCASIGGATGAVTIDSNTVRDINNYQSLTTTSVSTTTGILSSGAVASLPLNVRRNVVRDITTASASVSTSTSALFGISITGAAVAYNCSDNTVFNLNCAHSTAANIITCIYTSATGAGNSVITRNLMYNTTIASSSITAQHTGIFIFNASSLGYTISNNMISLGSAVTANQIIYGIDEESIAGAVYNIWFNSIYIGGAPSSNTARSACLFRETSTATWSIESNIFYNARAFSGSGSLTYGMIFNNVTGLAPNYNNIYVTGATGNTARNTALVVDYPNLTAWRSANPTFDAVSFSADPLFVSPSTATPDLHLQDPNPQSRAGGTNASVTVDFDGNTRPATAGQRPDMGADESNFGVTPNNMDYQGPAITFNSGLPLANIVAAGSRTLGGFAKIIDNGTLGSGSNAPRIYYRRIGIDPDDFTACFSGGNNSGGATGWRYTSATGNTGDDYDFNIDFTLVNGGSVSSGNQIGWFIAAQDLSTVTAVENLATNQAGGIATVSPAVNNLTTPFGTSSANYLFNISTALSGVLTVGTGGTYADLTGASGVFNALNTSVVNGDIYVSVLSDLSEPGTVALNPFTAPYTLQVRPSGSVTTRLIEGTTVTAAAPMIDVAGADRVSFNGADSATNAGQYFRFVNNNVTPASTGPVFRFINDARRDSVRNCIIESNSSSASVASVLLATTTNASGNDSISVDNCLFKQSAGTNPGRYLIGYGSTGTGSGAQRNSDNFLTNCNFTGMLATSAFVVSVGGTGNGDNWTVSGNKFYNDIVFTVSNTIIAFSNASTNNVTVNNNSIGGSAADRSGTFMGSSLGFAQNGISLLVGTTVASNIYNNTIGNWGNNGNTTSATANCITVTGGKVNIGSLGGNTLGGLANPWDSLRSDYDNGFITASSSDTTKIENNLIGNGAYRKNGGDVIRGIVASAGVNIIKNNIIRDLTGNNTGTGTSTFTVKGIQITSTIAGQIIEGNTIYNLHNYNGGAVAYFTSAIHFSSATGLSTVSRNRIYNITSAGIGTGVNAPVNCGIYNSSTALLNVINNQISLSGATLEPVLQGINNLSTGAMTVLYNSIYISGVCANLANTSHCYLRSSSSVDTVRNNLFFNERTGGANNYCIGVTLGGSWTSSSANYNGYFPATANQVGVVGAFTQQTFANWKTNATSDANSVSATGVNSANLFTATASGDLNINTANVECWNVAGLGTPRTTPQVLNDYGTSSTVRSVTVAGGSTDIGSDEFTAAGTPPDVIASGAPANSTTTTYTYLGRTIGSLAWGAGGTVPSSVTFKYYPGVNPPGSTGFNVSNGYWEVTVPDGSGYTYDVLFNYDEAQLGTVPTEADIRLAKSDNGGGVYTPYLVAGSGAGEYTLNTTANTIQVNGLTSFSMFGLADGNAPLPVELASFTASTDRRNVNLNWTTSSEQNNTGFDIERKLSSSQSWSKVGFVAGNGNSTSPRNYGFEDRNVETGKYNYRLKQIDNNGNHKYHQLSSLVDVGIPTKFDLSQNYPNPFNPTTKINYDLPFDSKVSIRLFDMTGREVAIIVNATQTAGYYTAQFNGSNLASGVYFYNIIAEGGNTAKFVTTKKMVLVK